MAAGLSNLPWPAIVGILSAVTMSVGNLTAMNQTNLKRLLAYSSIAHAGYGLMGLAAASALGVQSIMIYMLIYLVMNLGAFLAVIVIAEATGGETVDDCKGLIRRHPLLAISFTIFLFSLTGLPPFAGFMGKWYLFAAILRRYAEEGGSWYIWLGIVAALNTAVALYYYVRIIRAMIIDEPKGEIAVKPSLTYQAMLGAFSLAILVFGLWWSPIATWTEQSIAFFR
jgi:NADH-quinone oxidoreductase subunit N